MKIAVSAAGSDAGAPAEERFGRCAYFILFDEQGNLQEVINNEGAASAEGAGIKTTQVLLRHKVDVVLTGRVGPKAMTALSSSGVAVYTGVSGTVAQTLDKYREGLLVPITEPNTRQHSGAKGSGRVVK